jgi:ABC-2 type transport system permease protein
MKKYLAIVYKEILQLVRDWPGLIILFLMPAIMLIVITLSQEKVLTGRESGMSIVLVKEDSSIFGSLIEKKIRESSTLDLSLGSSAIQAEDDVFEGKAQVAVIIPQGAANEIMALAHNKTFGSGDSTVSSEGPVSIRILYDPAIMRIYKEMLVSSLQMIIESTAFEIYSEENARVVKSDIDAQFKAYREKLISFDLDKRIPDFPNKQQVIQAIQSGYSGESETGTEVKIPVNFMQSRQIIAVSEEVAGKESLYAQPNLVNNNIPAFILFAMFFIVLPLAGSIINEKQQGTRDRLMALPMNTRTFVTGKISVYLVVCFLQFLLMVIIGRFLFPAISSIPPVSLHVNFPALVLIVLASGFAAVGFGFLIGSVTLTYGQAAPLGSVLVVILAVLGGIFTPAYMMPDMIRDISVISPLRWGTDAFFSIFARQAGIKSILQQFFALILFFMVSMLVAIKAYNKRR